MLGVFIPSPPARSICPGGHPPEPPTTAARLYAAIYEDSAVAQSGRRSRSRLLAKLRPAGVLRQALAFAFACHGATAGVFPAASCVRDCSG